MAFAETFKALSDPVRREILNLLKGGRLTAGEIAGRFDMTAATVSYHLSQLKKAGLIFESREKNYIYYSLNASVLEEVLLWLQDLKGEGKKMKNNKREMLLTSLVCLLPLFAGAALYPRLPETMATHWDFSGNANGWSSRAATVFGLPLFILALHLVCFYAESRETKKNRNPVLRTVLLWFCPAVSLLGGAVTLGTGLGYEMPISTVVPVFMGLLFLILGNYLPKIRQNRTMGIKLPWTLQSEENWTRTHRLSGFLWVLCGLVMIPLSLLRLWSGWLFGALLAVMVLIPAVYSYALHRKGI